MTKTRISKKSLAVFPTNIAKAIADIKARYKTASFTYNEKNQGESFYFDEGAKVTCFYGEEEVSIKMVSASTVGSSESYAIGSTITPKAGTTILEVNYFMGKYMLSVYNFDLRLASA